MRQGRINREGIKMFYKNVLNAIGNTPLIRVPFNSPATILAKLEYLNPGGSMKDRSALYMIEQAEQDGRLKPGGTIIDASSGNHGITLAMIGAAKGYKVIIVISEKCSQEKYKTLKAYGAEVVVCPSTKFIDDSQSYQMRAQELHRQMPGSFMPNQYYNKENREGHYNNLGPEIWKQTEGKITHFFAGTGTGGTVSGVGQYLKEQNPAIKVYAIDSINSLRATEGNPKPYSIEGIGVDFHNEILNYQVIDEFLNVTDQNSIEWLGTLAHRYGLLVGPSSGAVVSGLMQRIDTLKEDDLAVIIFGDSGRAYLSKNFYGEYQDETVVQPLKHTTSSVEL